MVETVAEREEFHDRQAEQKESSETPGQSPVSCQDCQGGQGGEFGGRQPELSGDVFEGLAHLAVGPTEIHGEIGPEGRTCRPRVVFDGTGAERGACVLHQERPETDPESRHGPESGPDALCSRLSQVIEPDAAQDHQAKRQPEQESTVIHDVEHRNRTEQVGHRRESKPCQKPDRRQCGEKSDPLLNTTHSPGSGREPDQGGEPGEATGRFVEVMNAQRRGPELGCPRC